MNSVIFNFYIRWKVISLVRDPIARNISCFFESFNQYFPEIALYYRNNNIKLENQMGELQRLFLDNFDHEHNMPLQWFDTLMKPVFKIDVFTSEFSKLQGYKIFHSEFADLLLLRLENLNECSSAAFKDFLNIDNFTITSANVSQNKAYYPAYKKFLESVELPSSYIETMYTSKYVNHFYTKEEINNFKRKWSKGSNYY